VDTRRIVLQAAAALSRRPGEQEAMNGTMFSFDTDSRLP